MLTLEFVRSPKFAAKKAANEIDWWGIIFLAVAVGSLQYVLEKGQEEDWFNDEIILVLSIVSVFAFFFFIWREWTYKNPIVNLRVLANGNLRVGTVLSFILGFGLYGSTFIIPLYTQATLGWTATQSGMLMVPAAIVTAMMMPVVGQLLQRGVKQQYLVAIGMIFFFVYSYWGYLILTPDTGKDAFFSMLIVRGIGLGLLFVPITTLALSTLKGREIGEGAAFTGMMRQLGGSFGVAVITTFIARQNMAHRNDLVSKLDINSPVVQQRVENLQHSFMAKGMAPDVALNSGYKLLDFTVTKQAQVMSYMDVFLYLGVMFLICVPFVLWTRSGKTKVDASSVH